MCDRIIQLCNSSTKPLLFAGTVLKLMLAVGIGYIACTSHSLYAAIRPTDLPQSFAISYYLQLAAALYLLLVTLIGCISAYYDQKYLIRAVSFLSVYLASFCAIIALI